ncbi:MAG: rRNA maturation RNase YbeY [Rhodovarius sp.]|nr:rRNA maturation RNase YbeY [Rhodovarius sp.]MCX7931548.1 rRNA maturation RNase YbeY [Rhodovarius sp.]MDW8314856.1 rRNA maturation RNase YbeY [Rhodovarius sp.]
MPDRSSRAPAPPPVTIEVVTECRRWRQLLPRIERLVRRAAASACRVAGRPVQASVLLADDRRLRLLNHAHRGRAKPTNVLSFPAAEGVGDVALALGTIRREAAAAGKPLAAHAAHLVVHGLLHLLGHDHLSAGEARRMERAETRALRAIGLPDPWRRA